jgi:hypothetical protein
MRIATESELVGEIYFLREDGRSYFGWKHLYANRSV